MRAKSSPLPRVVSCLLFGALCIGLLHSSNLSTYASETQFDDVPSDSYAYEDILALRRLGIAQGVGNNCFAPYKPLTRGEFVTMLSRLLGWDTQSAPAVSFPDLSPAHYAYPHAAAAAQVGALDASVRFRASDNITREELAVMLIGALGYGELANDRLVTAEISPMTDLSLAQNPQSYGAVMMAYSFGIIRGKSKDGVLFFDPQGLATREEAAAMTMRLYRAYTAPLDAIHSFYAFSSSSQRQYAALSDSVSVGWSRLEYWNSKGGAYLNTTAVNSNEWNIPAGATDVAHLLQNASVPVNLTVFMDRRQKVTLPDGVEQRDLDLILLDPVQRAKAVEEICTAMSLKLPDMVTNAFSGVTIDFEGMTSESYRQPLSAFMTELRAALDALDPSLLLYIAVPPRGLGEQDYYKGYDYRAIGDVCDMVILMAHDYNTLSLPDYMKNTEFPVTPVTPFADIYYALRAICDPETGVQDKSKIALAVNFGTARWEIVDGRVQNTNVLYTDYASLHKRLIDPQTEMGYSDKYRNPYIRYFDSSDGTWNVVWYEDARSVGDKLDLARMFGIGTVSIWRLGIMPVYDDPPDRGIYFNAWDEIKGRKEAAR